LSPHDRFAKELDQEAAKGPVSFEHAVELMARSPLIQVLVEHNDLFRGALNRTDFPAFAMFMASPTELHELAHPTKRVAADLSRLIKEAETNRWAFEALNFLAVTDFRRPGMPNNHLRQWACERLSGLEKKFPRQKGASPRTQLRDAALTVLIGDATRLGFPGERNKASRDMGALSACDVVSAALKTANIPCPSVPALEKIWERNKYSLAWMRPK
jgi:hypothetical protein